MKRLKRFIIPIFISHAGCPNLCVFCNQNEITGTKSGKAEKINAKTVNDTVKSYLDTRPDWEEEVELAYFGGSFTSLPMKRQKELLSVGSDLIEKGFIDSIRVSTRPDAISEKIVDNLISHGVKTVELGVQSMWDEILDRSNRGHSAEDTVKAVDIIAKHGLSWIAQIMPGLPGDTEETILFTANRVKELEPQGVRIYPALVIKGTELEKLYKSGDYLPMTLDDTISVLKKMALIFDENSIPIIRIGLKPSKELEKSVVSGPYHSSIGSMVMESIMYDRVFLEIEKLKFIPDTLTIRVSPKRISATVGNNKINVINLKRSYNLKQLKIVQDNNLGESEVLIDGI